MQEERRVKRIIKLLSKTKQCKRATATHPRVDGKCGDEEREGECVRGCRMEAEWDRGSEPRPAPWNACTDNFTL